MSDAAVKVTKNVNFDERVEAGKARDAAYVTQLRQASDAKQIKAVAQAQKNDDATANWEAENAARVERKRAAAAAAPSKTAWEVENEARVAKKRAQEERELAAKRAEAVAAAEAAEAPEG